MIIFWRLVLAHLLTDFTLQTDGIAEWKRKSPYGVLVHSSVFLVLSLLLTREYLLKAWWILPGWASILVLFAVHAAEDQYRVWSIKKTGSPDSVIFFLWDQFLHIFFIFLFVPHSGMFAVSEKVTVILVLAVSATHLASILVYYFEQSIYGGDCGACGLKNKYYLIVERFAVFSCILLPGYWCLSAAAVLLLCLPVNRRLKLEFTAFNLGFSTAFVIINGILGRILLY
jgi:hypothetical protein